MLTSEYMMGDVTCCCCFRTMADKRLWFLLLTLTEDFQAISGWNLVCKRSLNLCISCRFTVLLLSLFSEFIVNKVKKTSESFLQGSIWYHEDGVSFYLFCSCYISLYRAVYISFPIYTGGGNRLHTGTPLRLLFRLPQIPCHSSFVFLWAQL